MNEIEKRYLRKTINQPDGVITHHGDCWMYINNVCTCGLLHDLVILENSLDLYPEFNEEFAKHENNLHVVQNFWKNFPYLKEENDEVEDNES